MIPAVVLSLTLAGMGVSTNMACIPQQIDLSSHKESVYFSYANDVVKLDYFPLREIERIECQNMVSQAENFERLDEIAVLNNNWNGYGAKPISSTLINKIRLLLLELPIQPELFPSTRDSIQLEYDIGDNHIEIEIFNNDNVEVMETDGAGHFVQNSFAYRSTKVREVVDEFYAANASRKG